MENETRDDYSNPGNMSADGYQNSGDMNVYDPSKEAESQLMEGLFGSIVERDDNGQIVVDDQGNTVPARNALEEAIGEAADAHQDNVKLYPQLKNTLYQASQSIAQTKPKRQTAKPDRFSDKFPGLGSKPMSLRDKIAAKNHLNLSSTNRPGRPGSKHGGAITPSGCTRLQRFLLLALLLGVYICTRNHIGAAVTATASAIHSRLNGAAEYDAALAVYQIVAAWFIKKFGLPLQSLVQTIFSVAEVGVERIGNYLVGVISAFQTWMASGNSSSLNELISFILNMTWQTFAGATAFGAAQWFGNRFGISSPTAPFSAMAGRVNHLLDSICNSLNNFGRSVRANPGAPVPGAPPPPVPPGAGQPVPLPAPVTPLNQGEVASVVADASQRVVDAGLQSGPQIAVADIAQGRAEAGAALQLDLNMPPNNEVRLDADQLASAGQPANGAGNGGKRRRNTMRRKKSTRNRYKKMRRSRRRSRR